MKSLPRQLSERWRRQPQGRRIVIGLIAVLAAGNVVVYGLWRAEPDYWRQARAFSQTHSEQEIRALADSVNTELARTTTIDPEDLNGHGGSEPPDGSPRPTGFYMTQPSDPTTITLDRDQLRAWVMTHLETAMKAVGARLPRAITNPVLDVQGGRFVLGFEYDSPEIQQVVSVYFRLGIEPDGRARVLLDGASAGRLPIPINAISKHLRKNDSHPTVEAVAQLIDGLDTYRFDPVMAYDGQRNVRLLGVALEEESAHFTVRFEPKGDKPK